MSSTQQFLLQRPHILARAVLYSSLFLILFILVLFWFATINITAKGIGIITTENGPKEIFIDSNGVILDIFITKGQEVKKGQILATISTDEVTKINTTLFNSNLIYQQTKKELESIENVRDVELYAANQTFLRAKEQERLSENLYKEGFITKIKYLKAKDALANATAQVAIVKSKYLVQLNEIKSKLLTIESNKEMNQRKILLSNAKRGNLNAEQYGNDAIYSPVDGIVALAQSWGINMSVKSNLPIFVIVPKNENLVANIEIPTSNMTNVRLGQKVKLKIDAYPYKQFGVWQGNLSYVSATSKVGNNNTVYEATVELDKNDIKIKNKPLIVGQTLHAEIVVERKRILIYLFDYLRGIMR